jgi:hypothetical protein
MATWQFDLHCLPSESVRHFYGKIPTAIPRVDFDEKKWWENVVVPIDLREKLSKLLPPMASWSEQVLKWGTDDGNRIDLVIHDDSVANFFIRIDVRNISSHFLEELVSLLQRNDWLLISDHGTIIQPSMAELLAAIRESSAFRYVENPKIFLEEMTKNNTKEM